MIFSRGLLAAYYGPDWPGKTAICTQKQTLYRAAFPRVQTPLALAAGGDSLDWKDYDASTITRRVISKVSPGSIVLFHNAALHTPEALPGILEHLLQNGYEVVPVSRLILPGQCGEDFTIDHAGRQHPAA